MRVLLSAILFLTYISLHAELIVFTNPDSYRDDGRVYWEQEMPGVLSFHLFSGKTPVSGVCPEVWLTLPEEIKLVAWGIFSTPEGFQAEPDLIFPAPEPSADGRIRLSGTPIRTLRPFQASLWTVSGNYHIYCFVHPLQAGKTRPIRWQIRAGNEVTEGTLFPEILSREPNRLLPRHFEIWSDPGYCSMTQPESVFQQELKLYRSLGVTHGLRIHLPFQAGNTMTPAQNRLMKAAGFRIADLTVLTHLFGTVPAREKLPEKEAMLRLDGKRSMTYEDRVKSNSLQLCPSALCADGGSALLRRYAEKILDCFRNEGADTFFIDYEKDIYDHCYCSLCRLDFARSEHLEAGLVSKLSAGELIARYPVELYRFRSRQTGKMFDMLRKLVHRHAPGIRIGNNSSLTGMDVFTPGIGTGLVSFCEDARFTDFGVDFHNSDMIKGGLEDMVRNDLLISSVTKPVIARVGAFCDINWNYFCVFSRKAEMRKRGQAFAAFLRPELLKLQTAHVAALGAAGVEVTLAPDVTDSLCHREFRRALDFIARNEELLRYGTRSDDVKVFSDGKISKAYSLLEARSHFARYYFYGPVKQYGAIQYVEKKQKGRHGVFLFNYDHFEARPVRIVLPSPVSAEITLNGQVYQVRNLADFSFLLPESGMASILLNVPGSGGDLPLYTGKTPQKEVLQRPWKKAASNREIFRNMVRQSLKKIGRVIPEAKAIQLQ